MTSNHFLNNFAEAGGAIKLTKIIPDNLLKSNHFEINLALIYGDNYASEPFRIFLVRNHSGNLEIYDLDLKITKELEKNVFESPTTQNNYLLSLSKYKINSGDAIPAKVLSFVIVDFFNQKVAYNFSQ